MPVSTSPVHLDLVRHGSTATVRYPSLDGTVELTGLVHLPHTSPGPDGWPVVTYGHMTTGAGQVSAPSIGRPGHPEWSRMSRGDVLCDRLLARGVAVLRPDYPGLGSPGPHPYLIGEPLADSVVAMVAARAEIDVRIGDRWATAGHSEGSLTALFTASRTDLPVPLRGAAAFAPVTRMDLTIGALSRMPVVPPAFEVLSGLVGLMLMGAASASDEVAALLETDLSPRAKALWPHLERRCLTELAARDSWGGLAASKIGSRRLYAALFAVMRANEVADLTPQVPVRIDAGLFDEVAPAWLTRRAVAGWRSRGVEVTHREWRSNHPEVMKPEFAPSEAADWLVQRLQ